MGTNYYVNVPACGNACDHCGQARQIHIGKSASGWRFLHRGYRGEYLPEPLTEPVTNRESWLRLLDIGPIFDEYGREHTRVELLDLIEVKQDGTASGSARARELGGPYYSLDGDFQDGAYDFCDREFS